MKSLIHLLSPLTLAVFLLLLLGNCVPVENAADDDFAKYLENQMKNYRSWINSNNLDPSPATVNNIKSGYYDSHINFNCEIRNHYVRGHSVVPFDPTSLSTFTQHYFTMGWKTYGEYESDGDFKCTGVILAKHYPELKSDLPFSGQGSFRIFQNYTIESVSLVNVGITRDYKLDLSHAWSDYELDAYQKDIRLQAEWNDTQVGGKYFNDIKGRFSSLYQHYPFYYDSTPSFPSGKILERYVREVAQGVDLRDIINVSYLPEPYVPTPTARTSTTESSNPKPGAGERPSIQVAGLITLQILILIWSM